MTRERAKTRTALKKRFMGFKDGSIFFVDATGNVFHFDRVRRIVVLLLILVCVSVAAAGITAKMAMSLDRDRQRLNRELTGLKQELSHLKAENAAISERLVRQKIQESEADPSNLAPGGSHPDITQPPSVQPLPDEDGMASKPLDANAEVEKPSIASSPDPETTEFRVSNFFVSHNPETQKLNVQFKLSKVSGPKGKTPGQTVVFLTGTENGEAIRLIMPDKARVVNNLTKSVNGRSFLISNYNYIRMSANYGMDIKSLKNARVMVFDAQGELITKRSFPITIN